MARTPACKHNANIYLSTSAEQDEPNMHLIYITIPGVQERQHLGWDTSEGEKIRSLNFYPGEMEQLFFFPHMVRNFAKHSVEQHILTPFVVLCLYFNPLLLYRT